MKKIISFILTVLLVMQGTAFFAYAKEEKTPVLAYSFEDAQNAPTLFGNAELVFDEDKKGNVLSLDGVKANASYAEIPQGTFDGMDVMTVQFDVLPKDRKDWAYFTFCFGTDNHSYSYFRLRDDEIRNCIAKSETDTWNYEQATNTTGFTNGKWMHIALVYNDYELKMYVDGREAIVNSNTGLKVSDLGTNLLSYLGKSLYSDDGYFHGCYDNFEVYDCVLSEEEIRAAAEANIPDMPVLRYTFEDDTTLPDLFGNAATVSDSEKGSKVLSLDGTSDTYAEIPQGFFDNKDEMTILFDIKPLKNSGNFFTFTIGQDNNIYDYFRIKGSEIRNAIVVAESSAWNYERDVKTYSDFTDSWLHIALVFDNGALQLYVNGEEAEPSNNNAFKVSEMGSNLISYIGKSFYSGDGYFNGLFDNFEVYDKVLEQDDIKYKATLHLPMLIGVKVGVIESNGDEIRGTDSHTLVDCTLNRATGEITSILQRRQDITAVPVKFGLNSDCEVYVDGVKCNSNCTLDLSYDRNVEIRHNDESEQYVIKAADIANNPVLPGMYADPDIDVFDGKFWIYPTTDGYPGWGGTQFHAFSSEDMETWTDEGVILDNKDKNPGVNAKGVQIASCVWSNGNAWAPSIEAKNGKYYFYFCGAIKDEYKSVYGDGMAIGVAYADSPAGPYTASNAPILYPNMMSEANFGFSGQVIDPAIYTEGDTSYILFGNGTAAIATLNSDMTTVDTSTLRTINGLDGFRESVAVFKRHGVYYWHWSCDDTGSENYHVRYGTSTSLDGEITYRGVLLEKDVEGGMLATAHQSIVYIPETDKCFIAYHRFYTPLSIGGNTGHHRETCVDEVTFNRQVGDVDLLNKVAPTMESVGQVYLNGISKKNYDAASLQNKVLEWNFGLTPAYTDKVNATTGNATMNLVNYYADYYYDGSNGLRTNDGFAYIENLAESFDTDKDIDITIKMVTNGRYNDKEAGSFAIGSSKDGGFNDLLYLKNDGTLDYSASENIIAGTKSGVSQGEHIYRIYFRNSTKTLSVYLDGKLIGFKQDDSLSTDKFNFLAIGVWRNTYYGSNSIEKVTISQPDIKDSGYINRDTLVSNITKQSVSQNIGYSALEEVIDEINSSEFQAEYEKIKNNEDNYSADSLKEYYAVLGRVKLFDASSAVYDYSNNTTVSGAADEVASIVSDFNSYSSPVYIGPAHGYNLTVEDKIDVNFYVDMEYYDADDDGYIIYSYLTSTDDKDAQRTEKRIDADDMTKVEGGFTDGDRKFTLTAAPAQIAEEYEIYIYDKNGNLKTDEPIKTSVSAYCQYVIDNASSFDEKDVNLAKALLDYGQSANIYFGYADIHNTANPGDDYSIQTSENYDTELSAQEMTALHEKASASFTTGVDASGNNITVTGVTYLALMEPEFRFYVSQTNDVWCYYTDISVNNGLSAQWARTDFGNCVCVTGLKASEFGKTFTVNIGESVLNYNGYAFLYTVLSAETTQENESLQAFAKSIYRYATACEEKFPG